MSTAKPQPGVNRGPLASYVSGFVLSVGLTLTAYLLVTGHRLGHNAVIATILLLAVAQFGVQLLFFLHLGEERKPRWNLILLSFMLLVLVVLVFGSIWIMQNLNYNMTPERQGQYIIHDEGIPPPNPR